MLDALTAVDSQAIYPGAAYEHGIRAEPQCYGGVGTAAYARVKEDWHLIVDALDDRRQGVERGTRPINLASPVVRDHDALHAVGNGQIRVIGVQDALDEDRQARDTTQGGEVVVRQAGVTEDIPPLRRRVANPCLAANGKVTRQRSAELRIGQKRPHAIPA